MQDENDMPTELDLDDLMYFAAQPANAWDHPVPADDLVPVRRAALRAAWDRAPEALLAYDAASDAVLIRFASSPSIIERELQGWLSVGFDAPDQDVRVTTVCIVGLRAALLPAPVLDRARLLVGPLVWDAATELIATGETRELRIDLPSFEAAALRVAWEQVNHTWDADVAGDAAEQISDSELEQWITEWTLAVAVHRDAGTAVPVVGRLAAGDSSEHEIPELAKFGVHPRITWQVDPDDEQRLIVRAAPLIDSGFAAGSEGPIAVQITGQSAWTVLLGDEYGDLTANIPLPSDQQELRIRIRHQPFGKEHH